MWPILRLDIPVGNDPQKEIFQLLQDPKQPGRIVETRESSFGRTDLAEIPSKYGVKNVYAELGTTFGSCAVTHPKLAAALVGTVIRGMGADHVIWGTDSVWYGSPQWQIDAMRRIEIPPKMRKQHHFQELGRPDSKVKSAIFAGNATRLFGLEAQAKT